MLAFKSACVRLRERGCLRECAKFDWQAKGGLEIVAVSRTVRLRKNP